MLQIESSLSLDDRAFLTEVREFIDTELASDLIAAEDAQRMFFGDHFRSNAWYEKLKRRRWHVAHWPREHGGLALSPLQNYLLLYEQGLRGAPLPRPFGINYVGPTVMRFGSERQKAEILPAIIRHDEHWCQGFSEPGSGSDLASVTTFAERRGDVYVINGSKIWTTDAQYADRIFCLVRTRRENTYDALSFMLLDMQAPGVSLQPIRLLPGDHELNQVFFDDVEAFPEQLLGPEGGGWDVAKYLLEIERGSFVFGGRLRRRLRRVVAAAHARRASADIWDLVHELEIDLLAYESTELRLGHLRVPHDLGAAAANIIKIEWTELLQRIDTLAVRLAGRDGVFTATPAAAGTYDGTGEIAMPSDVAAYFNNRAATIYGGSNEIQRNLIYRALKRGWQ